MSALLSLRGVTAGYAADIDILRNLSLSIEAARITGLIGLNGAGKSTLMKVICGFLRPGAGSIHYDGADITGIAPHTLIDRGIWYIPQESSLFPYMSVADNLRLPLERLARTTAGVEVDARFEEMLGHFPADPRQAARSGRRSLGRPAENARIRQGLPGAAALVPDRRTEHRAGAENCHRSLPMDRIVFRRRAWRYCWSITMSGASCEMSEYIYVMSLGEITAEGRRADFEGDLHEQVRSWLGVNF